MQVILLEKVNRLGDLGDTVNVKAGFGRNFLVPQGKAVPATKENVQRFEARRAELEKAAAERRAIAEARAEKLNAVELEIEAQCGDEGKLFGSIGSKDLVDAVAAKGVELEKSEVRLPDGPLRQTGEYEIDVQLPSEVSATIRVNVVAAAGG